MLWRLFGFDLCFWATDSVIGNVPAEIKKIVLSSESDCLRNNFTNASQMSLFDVIWKLIRSLNKRKNINKSKKGKK